MPADRLGSTAFDADLKRRRDPRFYLREGVAYAEFADAANPETRWTGRLVTLSAAGMALVAEVDGATPAIGDVLKAVSIHVGTCRIRGRFVVKSVVDTGEDGYQFGGLFYPESDGEASRLMALIAGMQAVSAKPAPEPVA